jgi:DNA-binding beta-propeller fold protein YncE
MKINHVLSLLSCALLLFQASVYAEDITLEQLWETDALSNPESVVYDGKFNTIYVSNVNGGAGDKDGNGFISRLSPDGKVLDQEWVKGLNAPKGLALSRSKLYTADIDTLVEIDIATAAITHRYQITDAKFLNDVAAAPNGDIYVSDMSMNRIHLLHDGKFSIWLETPGLLNPNGVLVQGKYLIVGAWGVMTDDSNTKVPGHLLKVSLRDKGIKNIGSGLPIGNLDGVEPYKDDGYLVTDWMAGKLMHITKSGEVTVLLTLEQGTADLTYIPDLDLILLPMMNSNKLIAYKVHENEKAAEDEDEEEGD